MITWIGLCAGDIWHYLEKNNGEASLENIFADIQSSQEVILMALGWLAREGHITLLDVSPGSRIKLKSGL